MLSKTTTSFAIDTRSLDDVSALKFTVATELTELYEPGRPIDPVHRVVAIRGATDAPIVFTVGTDDGVYVVFPDATSTTGWNQVDLRQGVHAAFPGIAATARGYLVAASQDQDQGGTFRLAVAVAGQNGPAFFVSRDAPVAEAGTVQFWKSGLRWVERPGLDKAIGAARVSGAVPTSILLGTRDDGAGAPTMIAVLEAEQVAHRYFVNADLDDQRWVWAAYALTQDVEHVDDMVLGTIPVRDGNIRGTFVIGRGRNDQRALYFTSLPSNVSNQTQSLHYLFGDLPPNATAITALPGEIPRFPGAYGTDLYVGGQGVRVIKAYDMALHGSNARAREIVSAKAAPGVQQIVGSLGGGVVSLWFTTTDAGNDLAVVRGSNRYEMPAWSAPVPLFKDVLQIAPLRDARGRVEDVLMVTGDNRLRYLFQDQKTTLWITHELAIHDTRATVAVRCYRVKIGVKSAPVKPFAQRDKLFAVSSSQWGYVTVNDVVYLTSPDHPVSVGPSLQGTLTITQPVSGMAAPIFHVSAPFLTDGFDVHPAGVLNQQLNGMSADGLLSATYAFNSGAGNQGDQVVTGRNRDQQGAQSGVKALQHTTNLNRHGLSSSARPVDGNGAVYLNSTVRPLNQVDPARLHANGQSSYGISGGGSGGWSFSFGKDVDHMFDELGDSLKWYAGDLFHHVDELFDNPVGFFVRVKDDSVTLFVKLKEIVVELILTTIEEVLKAIAWLLDSIFGIDLSRLLAWLGFLFDFQYYRYTQQWLDSAITDLLGKLEGNVEALKQFTVGMLDQAESYIRRIEPISHPAGNTSVGAASQASIEPILDVAEFLTCNPVGSWILDKAIQALGALNGDATPSWETDLANRVMAAWRELLTDEVMNVVGTIGDLLDDLVELVDGDLSMNQLLEQVAGDVLVHALEAVKGLIVALFDVMEAALEAVRLGLIPEGIEIPIVSAIYRAFTGSDLRVKPAEITEFIIAIPTTMISIFATGEPPFRHAHPMLPPYTLDFGVRLPPAQASSVSAGAASVPRTAVAKPPDSDRPGVSLAWGWVFTSTYSVGKVLDIAGDLAVAWLKAASARQGAPANPISAPVFVIRVGQIFCKGAQLVGGIPNLDRSLAVSSNHLARVLKLVIFGGTVVRMVLLMFELGIDVGKRGVPPQQLTQFENGEQVALGIDATVTAVLLVLESIAIGLEWGENSTVDDALLVTQQACEYGADLVATGNELAAAFGKVSDPRIQIAIDLVVGAVGLAGFALNVSRTGVDASHHRNY